MIEPFPILRDKLVLKQLDFIPTHSARETRLHSFSDVGLPSCSQTSRGDFYEPESKQNTSEVGGFIIVACGIVSTDMLSLHPTFAQQSRRNQIQRWEYCAITNAYELSPTGQSKEKYIGLASICYFRTSGCRREEVRFELIYADFLKEVGRNANENANRYFASVRAAESALSKAVAKLGDDGWEMVGDSLISFVNEAETNTRYKALYFKRRKP